LCEVPLVTCPLGQDTLNQASIKDAAARLLGVTNS